MDADIWRRSDAVLERAREALDHDQNAVLVTLVDVEGSAYRRPGAKRLLEPDGESVGTVVPGCLDARLARLAESVLDDGTPTTATFDLREDDTWGLGVGCDGVVELLVEPLDGTLKPALDALAKGRTTAVATVLDGETDDIAVGDRAVFEGSGSIVEADWPSGLGERVSELVSAADERNAGTVTVGGSADTVNDAADTIELFVEWFEPSPRLIVFGTGPDVDPLVEAARFGGFSPIVVGFRGEAGGDRFTDASAVVSTRPSDIREAVDFDADTAAVVATHNAVDDRLTVEQLLETPVSYIGVVGSRERYERLLDTSEIELSPADRERLYGPAGLDLGGGTPEQIALSIISEALAVCNDRRPDHLRERAKPIHERSAPES